MVSRQYVRVAAKAAQEDTTGKPRTVSERTQKGCMAVNM